MSEDKYVFNDGALIRLGDSAIKSWAGKQTSQCLKINFFQRYCWRTDETLLDIVVNALNSDCNNRIFLI